MYILDVISGFYLPYFYGWIFLGFILIVESLVLSKFLFKTWFNAKVYFAVFFSNIITTILGFVVKYESKTGAALLRIPVDYYKEYVLTERILDLFLTSFIATVVMEALINKLILRGSAPILKIVFGTVIINLITYSIGYMFWYLFAYQFVLNNL